MSLISPPHYNESLSHPSICERIRVVLVRPRNPLNIGAAARAMANFGFSHLAVVAPYERSWREACSAVGAEELLQQAHCVQSLAEALAGCTLAIGSGTLTYRKAEQPVLASPEIAAPIAAALAEPGGQVALVFGSEKNGLTREELSWCRQMVVIPTSARQPSMNLAQSVAVLLYEVSSRLQIEPSLDAAQPARATSDRLDLLAAVVAEALALADYSPAGMRPANQHDLRLMLRRLAPSERDLRRLLGAFRRILWRLKQCPAKPASGARNRASDKDLRSS